MCVYVCVQKFIVYSFLDTKWNRKPYIYIYPYRRGSLDKFPDFFRMDNFIDSTYMKL